MPSPTFDAPGFAVKYAMPVYVSADSILYGVHTSFDILEQIEEQQPSSALKRLLATMQLALVGGERPAEHPVLRDGADRRLHALRS